MIKARVALVSIFIVAGFILITFKLFKIQVLEHEKYKFLAERQQNKSYTVKAERGVITDRKGDVLALTTDDVSYYVDKRMAKKSDIEKISEKFAEIFNKPADFYMELINTGKGNICLEKKASKSKALKLEGFVANGFFSSQDFTRLYPHGSLAGHVLGYVDYENRGANGVEKYYDDKLEGSDGLKWIERNGRGQVVSINQSQSVSPRNGDNITLTINRTYQNILEKQLAEGMKNFGSDSAVGIIQNPNTGEILAMACFPNYDPNNYNLFSNSSRRNRAVTDTYEPGSTMKAVTFSVMLEENLLNLDRVIDTENGIYKYHGIKIRDSHPAGKMTTREVLEFSSNIGMTKLTENLDKNLLYKYLRDFGFGNPTSIDLPGEAKGYLKKPSLFSGISKPYIAIGYEVSVTPLQMITAFSAIINGGILYKPFVVKEITDNEGRIIKTNKPKRIRRVIKKETSDRMRNLLVGVVEKGTGTAAKMNDVLIGGKTGTSQKLEGKKYSKLNYNSSFIGFLPADNPQIICLILLDSPKKGKYGGRVAAPIFRKIAEDLIDADLSLVPEESRINRTKNYIDEFFSDLSVPKSSKFEAADIPEIRKPKPAEIKAENKDVMPNLKNLSIREAISILSILNINYKIVGSGKVIKQSVKPGTKIGKGMFCLITGEKMKLKSVRLY